MGKTKYCQVIHEVNTFKRLNAKKCLAKNDSFDYVLWSDEGCIKTDWNRKISFQRWMQPPKGDKLNKTAIAVVIG